jgi:predicted ATPase
VREVAQIGATLGREFSYELLKAVSLLSENTLQQGLKQLVEAELVYQSGIPPQARYLFKHALVQDTAYQSLLKSRRQQLHQQVAQVLVEQFVEVVESQPELVAHHYTEAGFIEQAIPYWQRAGERAVKRSANVEAISHFTKGLELLNTLPDNPERLQQELTLQLSLGTPLNVTRGFAALELEKVYARARELSQQVGETPQLRVVLYGLCAFYLGRAVLHTARELAKQLFTLVQSTQDSVSLLMGYFVMAVTLLKRGEFVEAREHAKRGIELYDRYRSQSSTWQAHHFGVGCLNFIAWVLWVLGYPDLARRRTRDALTLAQEKALPFTLAEGFSYAAWLHQTLREWQAAEKHAVALVALCTEQGFPLWQASGTIVRGRVLVEQGSEEEGVAQIHQGLADYRATGAELLLPDSLGLLASVYTKRGQAEEGLKVVVEALERVEKTGGSEWEAELYRLKGELLLIQTSKERRSKSQKQGAKMEIDLPSLPSHPQAEAEECFLKAIEVAQKQRAKSWELRAATNLARLWQQQGKRAEAHKLLSDVYSWFTEGFDTKDLQEAKALLEELAG